MIEQEHEFQLSADESKYLAQLASRDESLARLLHLQEFSRGRVTAVRLTPIAAEQLRELLTTLLATVGFDEDLSPNEEGRILEKLIDNFYLG